MIDEQYTTDQLSPLFDEHYEYLAAGYLREIRKGRIALFVLGCSAVVGDFILMSVYLSKRLTYNIPLVIALDAAILGIYVGLGFLTKKKPLLALSLGLLFMIALTIYTMILSPKSIVGGIIFKGIVSLYLIRALKAARAYEQMNTTRGIA